MDQGPGSSTPGAVPPVIPAARRANPEPRTQNPEPGISARTRAEIPWQLIARSAPKHSILIWLSDFAPRESPEGWPVLQRRYQTMGFRVDDPWERALPAGDTLVAYDPLTGRLVMIDGSAAQRTAHADWIARREAAFRDLFPDALSRLVVSTQESRLDALVRFFHARMRTRTRR